MNSGSNQTKATVDVTGTPEQTKKVIILVDSIVKHDRGFDLSHTVENARCM